PRVRHAAQHMDVAVAERLRPRQGEVRSFAKLDLAPGYCRKTTIAWQRAARGVEKHERKPTLPKCRRDVFKRVIVRVLEFDRCNAGASCCAETFEERQFPEHCGQVCAQSQHAGSFLTGWSPSGPWRTGARLPRRCPRRCASPSSSCRSTGCAS